MARKNIIYLSFVITLFYVSFALVIKISAIKKFPNSIIVNSTGWINGIYGQQLAAKTYTAKVNGESIGGKVFCASMRNQEPYNYECKKMKWSNSANDLQNEKISVGIGALIKYLRDSSGKINWTKYFHGEVAINDFLSTYNFGNSSNNVHNFINNDNVNASLAYRNIIFDNYHKYNNLSIELSSISLNGKKLNGTNVIHIPESNMYKISFTMKCFENKVDRKTISYVKDSNGNNVTEQIKCDLPSFNYNINKNNNSNSKISVKENKKTVEVTIDITDQIKSNNTYTISITGKNKRKHYAAQRYNCGVYQTVVPNLLNEVYSAEKNKNISGKFQITSNNSEKSCPELVSNDPASNASLYSKHKNDSNYGSGLLDIQNPSCDNFSESPGDASCESASMKRRFVKSIVVNGTAYDALCNSSFVFNNLVSDKQFGKKGTLIFNSDNQSFGTATISYNCNIAALYSNTDGLSNINYSFELKDIIPSISLKIFNNSNDIKINGVINNIDSGNCSLQNGKINCKNYYNKTAGFGWYFTAQVDYRYPSTQSYKNTYNGYESCTGDCTDYGIHVPSNLDKELSSGDMKISIDGNNSVFKEKLDTSCSYNISTESFKKEVLYRTINVDKPFVKMNGENRPTGDNWCEKTTDINEISEIHPDYDKPKQQCLYLGDVDGDYNWTDKDIYLLKNCVKDNSCSSKLNEYVKQADINLDKIVDDKDIEDLQNLVSADNRYLLGDANLDGSVDDDDVFLIQLHLAGQVKFTPLQEKLANFDYNECDIDIDDVTFLQAYLRNRDNDNSNIGTDQFNDEELLNNQDDSSNSNITKSNLCKYNNKTVQTYITNRPNSNSKEPLYSFTLDAKTIKAIRSANNNDSYNQDSGKKTASEYLQKLYPSISSSKGLCYSQTMESGYCNVDEVIKNKESA